MLEWLNNWQPWIFLFGTWAIATGSGVSNFVQARHARLQAIKASANLESLRRAEVLRMQTDVDRFNRTMEDNQEKMRIEASRWREEARDTRKAEAAARLLTTILRHLAGLRRVTSPAGTAQLNDGNTSHQRFRSQVEARWRSFVPLSDAFEDATHEAEPYLPSAVFELITRIRDMESEVFSNQQTYLTNVGPHLDTEFWKHGFGDGTRKVLDGFADEARKLLRPMAQMNDGAPEGPAKTTVSPPASPARALRARVAAFPDEVSTIDPLSDSGDVPEVEVREEKRRGRS